MHVDRAFVANHNQLLASFKQMKSARPDFGHKPVAPDFIFHPQPVAPDHAAGLRGFGRKNLRNPQISRCSTMFYRTRLVQPW